MSIRKGVIILRPRGATPSGSAPSDAPPPQSPFPSSGAIAGIAIAGAVAVFGTMAFVFFVVLRHQRRRTQKRSGPKARDLEEEASIHLPPHQSRAGHSNSTMEVSSDISLIHAVERSARGGSTKKAGRDAEKNLEGGYLRQGYMSMSLEDALPAYSVPSSIPDTQPHTSTQPLAYLESSSNVTAPAPKPIQQSTLISPPPLNSSLPNPHRLLWDRPSSESHASGRLPIESKD